MAFFNAQGNINIDVSDALKNTKTLSDTFNSAMGGMSKSAQSFADKWSEATYGIKDTKRIVSGILISQSFYTISNAAITASGAVLQFSKDMETSAISMEYFVKGSEKAARSLAFLREANTLAARTPFKTSDVLSMSKYMQAMGIAMEKTKSVLTVITDAAAATGATQQNLERIVFGLGQIQTKGRLANEEIRQLANANIPIYEILQEELGLTGAQIANIGTQWISSEKATNAILTGLEKRYKGAADRISETFTGMTDTVKDNLLIISQAVMNSPYDSAVEVLRSFRDELDSLRETATSLGSAGVINKVLTDIDPSGKIGTDILNMIGNVRALGFTIADMYQEAKPTLGLIGQSFYVTGQLTVGSLRMIGETITVVLGTLNELGVDSEEASRAIATLFIAYKASQALGTLGQGMALVAHNIRLATAQAWSMIPATAGASTGIKLLTTSVIGAVGAFGLAYFAWKQFNAALGGTGENLKDSLPTNYTSAYDKYLEDMNKYNEATAKYQDDYNEPFNNMEEAGSSAFERLEDDAKKTAKAIKDGFIASFDEVYQVNQDNKDELKDAFDPVDFGAGIQIPEFKFPTVKIDLPEAPKLDVDAIFDNAIDTNVVNGDELGKFLAGSIGTLLLGGLGNWFSRFYVPKKGPKSPTAGGGTGSGGSGVKATDPVAVKLEAYDKRFAELQAVQREIASTLKVIEKTTDVMVRAKQIAYLERLVDQGQHSFDIMHEIAQKTPTLLKNATASILEQGKSFLNKEKMEVLIAKKNEYETKLAKDQVYATSADGDKTRELLSKNNKQIIETWKYQQTLSDKTALDNMVPADIKEAFMSLEDRTKAITNAYDSALVALRTHNRDSVTFMESLTNIREEAVSLTKAYEKANIAVPDLLNELIPLTDVTARYNKLSAEKLEIEKSIAANNVRLNALFTDAINGATPEDTVAIKNDNVALQNRLVNIQEELRKIKLQMQHPTQADIEMLKGVLDQAKIDKEFKSQFTTLQKDLNILLKPLKILHETDKQILDTYVETQAAVKSALAEAVSEQARYIGILKASYDEVIAVVRDSIAKSYDIKQISDDMYNGVTQGIITAITKAGLSDGVSTETLGNIIANSYKYIKQPYADSQMQKFYKDLITVTGDLSKVSVAAAEAIETETKKIAENTANAIEKLNTIKESLDENVNALKEFKEAAAGVIKETKQGLTSAEWKQISADILAAKNDIVKELKVQESIMQVTGAIAKSTDTSKILWTLNTRLDEIADKATSLNSISYFESASNKLVESAKKVYGSMYNEFSIDIRNSIKDIVEDLKAIGVEGSTKAPVPPTKTTTEVDIQRWKDEMFRLFPKVVPDWLTEHNPAKLWEDSPWQFMSQNIFRNPYVSGGDVAGLSNSSQYDASQFLNALISNLTESAKDAEGITGQPVTIELLDRMVRGRVYESLAASTMKEALELRNGALADTLLKVFQGGYFIDATHTIQAQLDNLLVSTNRSGDILEAISMDEKVLSGDKFEKIMEKVANIADNGNARYYALRGIAPDVAEQFVAQAIVTGANKVALNMINADLISDRPNYSDYSFFDLSDKAGRAAAESMLEEFYTISARNNSHTSKQTGNRVWNVADLGNTKPILIEIPREAMDQLMNRAKKFLEIQAKLVGVGIDGSLKKYLVGYTKSGIPVDLYGTKRNMPTVGDVLAELKKVTFDTADSTRGLNSAIKDIVRDLKSSSVIVRTDAMTQLTTAIQELTVKATDAGVNDTPIPISIGKADLVLTPTTMSSLASVLEDVQLTFAPDTQLAMRMKTLNDMVGKINANVGESLVNNRELHDLVYNAQKSAVGIESIVGATKNLLSTQLSQIITNQVVSAVDYSSADYSLKEFEEWFDHTAARRAAEEAERNIKFDDITKQYQETVNSMTKAQAPVPILPNNTIPGVSTENADSLISTIAQLTGDASTVTKTIAELALLWKSNDVTAQNAYLASLKTTDPDALKKALDALFKGNGSVTLGSGFGAYADMTTKTWEVIKQLVGKGILGTTNAIGSSPVGRFGSWASEQMYKPIDKVSNGLFDLYNKMREATGMVRSTVWYPQGYTKASFSGIVNPHWVDNEAGVQGPNMAGLWSNKYIASILNARSTVTGEGTVVPQIGNWNTQFEYKLPEAANKALNSTRTFFADSSKVSNFLNNLPMYLQIASLAADNINSLAKADDYARFRKKLEESGTATLDLEKLLADAVAMRGEYTKFDFTGLEHLNEQGIMKNLVAKGMWDPDAFELLYKAAEKQFDSISAQEKYFLELARGGDSEKYRQAAVLGTNTEAETADMLTAIRQLITSNSDVSVAVRKQLENAGYDSAGSIEDLSDEALAYLATVVKEMQANYEAAALQTLDKMAQYDPANDNPLLADVTRLVQGLDVDNLSTKVSTEIANTLGIVFSQREGDDAVTLQSEKIKENIVGWTQRLPENLKIENLSTEELAVLAKAGVQINSDGTGTFMLAQNVNKTGTSREIELDAEDFADRILSGFKSQGIQLDFSGESAMLNLDTTQLVDSMVGALMQIPTLANGDSFQASIDVDALDKLESVIKFYDSGMMEIVDPKVLAGTKTLQQALDDLVSTGGILEGGLSADVYNALVAIDDVFATDGAATAEKIAQFADGIRVELSTPFEWFSPEQKENLAAIGITLQQEGEKTYAVINKLADDLANGIVTMPLTEFSKLNAGTIQALKDLGVGITTEGANVKISMQDMLDAGIKDVITLYMDDQGLWDKLPTKIKETMAANGVATSEGFLVINAATSEGMAQLGSLYAQKWDNISTDTKSKLDEMGMALENELLTMQVVAKDTPAGEGEILAKFEDLPAAIQQVLTGGDASIAATLSSDDTRIKLASATEHGFSDIATAVSTAMGAAENEVDQAVSNMAEAISIAMQNMETLRIAKQAAADTANNGLFDFGYTTGTPKSLMQAGKQYIFTPAFKNGKLSKYIGYSVTTGAEKEFTTSDYTAFESKRKPIPAFAEGGIISSDGLYRAGEFGKTEAIIPLENESALSMVGQALAKYLPQGTYNITMAKSNLEVTLLQDMLDVLREIESKIDSLGSLKQSAYTPLASVTPVAEDKDASMLTLFKTVGKLNPPLGMLVLATSSVGTALMKTYSSLVDFSSLTKTVTNLMDSFSSSLKNAGTGTGTTSSSSSKSSSGVTIPKTGSPVLDVIGTVAGAAASMISGALKGKYASGGINDFTGIAQLDGSKASVETIFNATDGKKLYNLVHNTDDLASRVVQSIVASINDMMPTRAQVAPLMSLYGRPNGGITTDMSPKPVAQPQQQNPETFAQTVLEAILPAIFSMTEGSQDDGKTPIYVGNLIATEQGLTELERRLYDIRTKDRTRR